MMFKLLSLSIGIILIINLTNANPNTTETFYNKLVLQSPDLVYLYWNHDNNGIVFELHVKNTSKWIAFGIMGANFGDAVVSWIGDDYVGSFSDNKLTFGLNNQTILMNDRKQNWLPMIVYQQDGYTVHKFSRYIKVCDQTETDEDVEIVQGQNRIFYAAGNDFNPNGQIALQSVNYVTVALLTLSTGPFVCPPDNTKNFTSTPTGMYTNYVDLVDQGQYRFYWNYTQTDLIGEIHCRTSGWVGFGFSPNGNMDQSDVVVGWISNGLANFTVIKVL